MFPFSLPWKVQLPIYPLVLYLLLRLNRTLRVAPARRRKALALGCLPARHCPRRFFGLEQIYLQFSQVKQHTLLSSGHQEFFEYGHTFGLTIVGTPVFSTNEPANVQHILATDFANWGIGVLRQTMVPLLGEGIFSTDGAKWRHSRDLLRPNFNRAQVAEMGMFEKHFGNLMKCIGRERPGETVDLQPLFLSLAMDISTEFLFGESTDDLAAETSKPEIVKFVNAWNRSTKVLGASADWKSLANLFWKDKQFLDDCKTVHEFADAIIEKAKTRKTSGEGEADTESSTRYLFLAQLFEQISDPIKIRAELLNILIAGRETTASVLTNSCFELARRPDVQARLRAEIAGLNDLDFETIKNLRYLRAFINESLRLYPIVPINSRQAIADTTLPIGGGNDQQSPVFVSKHTLISWNLYSMHRRKEFFGEDAEEFRPERWLDEDEQKGIRPGWAFLPFNGGPRICIGQQFALTEISYIIIRLLQEYSSIESRDSEPWRESMQLTCINFGGCKVALTPRS